MGKADDGLRGLFHSHLTNAQWTAVETGMSTISGVPDSEYCFHGGVQGWIEFKRAHHWRVKLRPEQISWIARRARYGGAVFIGVRRRDRDANYDELWLMPGQMVAMLAASGLKAVAPRSMVQHGGPSQWDWQAVARFLGGS